MSAGWNDTALLHRLEGALLNCGKVEKDVQRCHNEILCTLRLIAFGDEPQDLMFRGGEARLEAIVTRLEALQTGIDFTFKHIAQITDEMKQLREPGRRALASVSTEPQPMMIEEEEEVASDRNEEEVESGGGEEEVESGGGEDADNNNEDEEDDDDEEGEEKPPVQKKRKGTKKFDPFLRVCNTKKPEQHRQCVKCVCVTGRSKQPCKYLVAKLKQDSLNRQSLSAEFRKCYLETSNFYRNNGFLPPDYKDFWMCGQHKDVSSIKVVYDELPKHYLDFCSIYDEVPNETIVEGLSAAPIAEKRVRVNVKSYAGAQQSDDDSGGGGSKRKAGRPRKEKMETKKPKFALTNNIDEADNKPLVISRADLQFEEDSDVEEVHVDKEDIMGLDAYLKDVKKWRRVKLENFNILIESKHGCPLQEAQILLYDVERQLCVVTEIVERDEPINNIYMGFFSPKYVNVEEASAWNEKTHWIKCNVETFTNAGMHPERAKTDMKIITDMAEGALLVNHWNKV